TGPMTASATASPKTKRLDKAQPGNGRGGVARAATTAPATNVAVPAARTTQRSMARACHGRRWPFVTKACLSTQVSLAEILVRDQVGGRPLQHQPPSRQHVAAVGDRERHV